jgi:alkaline phosphatase D
VSRAETDHGPGRPRLPARRQALFAARDAMMAALATPSLAAVGATPAGPPPLQVVHGFADQQGIALWMQGAAAQSLRVEVQRTDAPAAVLQLRADLDPRADCSTTLPVSGLEPGAAYRYVVRDAKGPAMLASGSFRTQPLWQWRGDPPTVRIVAGSCNYLNDNRFDRPGTPYGGGEEIFDSIAATSPDLMLWLGDNLYLREPEWTSPEGINRRYRYYRTHPAMRKVWTAAPHVAIWDDHDFGPDNADASFSGKGWTLEMFRRYWPLPYSMPAGGMYGMVTQGDVDIFLLDDRSNRYPNAWPEGPDKVMYGGTQMQWLKAALSVSKAPFKLVAGGSQFWNGLGRAESWARYPAEQQDLRRFLDERRIPGVVFLSGDRHFAQMYRMERPGLYPLYELTTSPLTAGPTANLGEAERQHPDMVPGTLFQDRNFAMLTVSGPRTARALTIELMDQKGGKRWEWRTTAAELVPPRA